MAPHVTSSASSIGVRRVFSGVAPARKLQELLRGVCFQDTTKHGIITVNIRYFRQESIIISSYIFSSFKFEDIGIFFKINSALGNFFCYYNHYYKLVLWRRDNPVLRTAIHIGLWHRPARGYRIWGATTAGRKPLSVLPARVYFFTDQNSTMI